MTAGRNVKRRDLQTRATSLFFSSVIPTDESGSLEGMPQEPVKEAGRVQTLDYEITHRVLQGKKPRPGVVDQRRGNQGSRVNILGDDQEKSRLLNQQVREEVSLSTRSNRALLSSPRPRDRLG